MVYENKDCVGYTYLKLFKYFFFPDAVYNIIRV